MSIQCDSAISRLIDEHGVVACFPLRQNAMSNVIVIRDADDWNNAEARGVEYAVWVVDRQSGGRVLMSKRTGTLYRHCGLDDENALHAACVIAMNIANAAWGY